MNSNYGQLERVQLMGSGQNGITNVITKEKISQVYVWLLKSPPLH